MKPLYEIGNDLIGLQHLIDEGELDAQMLSDTMEGVVGAFEDKSEGVLSVIANIGSDVDSLDSAIKRLQARKKTMTNHQTWLREYLKINMEKADINKITCTLFSVTLTKARQMLDVIDESLIPDDYFVEVPATRKLDRAQTLSALKSGQDIPGARLGESARGILIK